MSTGRHIRSNGITGLYSCFNISCVGIIVYRGLYFGMYDSLKPVVFTGQLQDSFFATFFHRWLITNGAGLASDPIDTARRRMMMTTGETVKYKGSLDAFSQILKNDGAKSLFMGADANIHLANARAGVLSGCEKLQQLIIFGKKYGVWRCQRKAHHIFVYVAAVSFLDGEDISINGRLLS